MPSAASAVSTDSHSLPDEKAIEKYHAIDEEKYKKIRRKIDINLLPLLSLLYFLSFLDRSNIGNARIAGMAKDLDLVGLKYNIVVAVFFILYAFAEVPSNLCLKIFRPSIWIPSIMLAWGLVMTLMCLCKTYEGLLIARVFLGLAEAGLFPGITYYLSLWYRRRDVALRIAIFFSAATVAGDLISLLALYGIVRMEGIGGLHGWQWIFCLEGILTVVVAFAAFYFMNDYPATAAFLSSEEREIVIAALEEDSQGLATQFNQKFIWQAMKDYKTYVHMGIYSGAL
ncbi:hypothetical protein H0H81_007658 [Sphagnurus paluster]|uniref:Major facilitator superfamily (MFS) profile domain-containing protein n=1 Tax=Sphagnurus paluster TaxID=117069 RepID=A0A9P7K7E3_9AGAR|nr:hypothetical protein H0H81_007658 [Sphagnurus paluster]